MLFFKASDGCAGEMIAISPPRGAAVFYDGSALL